MEREGRWGGGKGSEMKEGQREREWGGGLMKEREGGESINEGVKEAGREECKASCVKYLTLCKPL